MVSCQNAPTSAICQSYRYRLLKEAVEQAQMSPGARKACAELEAENEYHKLQIRKLEARLEHAQIALRNIAGSAEYAAQRATPLEP